MSSSTPKPKIRESLLEAISKFGIYAPYYGYAREIANNALDALEYGYCRNRNLLNGFLVWYEKGEYPALKKLAPKSDEIAWVEKLKEKVDQIKAKIKQDGNFQQNHMLEQFALFCERHRDIPNRDKYLRKLRTKGHCSGFAFLDTCAFYSGRIENVEKVFKAVALWNGKDDSIDSLKADIIICLEFFYKAQHSPSVLAIEQGAWHKLNRNIKQKAEVALPEFSDAYIEESLNKILLAKKTVKKQSMSILVHEHTTVIHQIEDVSRFYDSNCLTGGLIVDKKGLKSVIKAAHCPSPDDIKKAREEKKLVDPTPFRVQVFSADDEELKISPKDFSAETKVNPVTVLSWAIASHDKATYDFWLPKIDRRYVPPNGHTVFHTAAFWNCAKFINDVPEELSPDVNEKTLFSQRTALHYGARFGYAEVVDALCKKKKTNIDARISATARKHAGWTPLHVAVKYGHVSVVKVILFYSPRSIDTLTPDGKDALAIAKEFGRIEMQKLLAQKQLDVAMQNRDQAKVMTMIQTGVIDIHAPDPVSGLTLLQRSAQQGLFYLARFLVFKGVDINKVGHHGTALQIAAKRNDTNLAGYLLRRGANFDSIKMKDLLNTSMEMRNLFRDARTLQSKHFLLAQRALPNPHTNGVVKPRGLRHV